MPREPGSQAGPIPSRDEADDAAARKARRQKRREEEAYHVKGWENLYRGGGSKPVFAHDPLPSSKSRRQGQSSSQSPIKSNVEPASSSRRTQSPAKASRSNSASASKLPPSTAPPSMRSMTSHASTSRLAKRKVSTPSLQTSPNKKSKAAAAALSTLRQMTQGSDDSDDDFEITGASGPAATRFSSNVAPASGVKVSPSADSSLNVQPSSSLRRSVSKAPSAEIQSPAAPSLPAQDDETSSLTSAPASRGASKTRASASSSLCGTPGPVKHITEEIEALKDIALREYEQGISLAQHIDKSVHDFIAGLRADHPDLHIVNHFRRKVADLGAHLTIKELRVHMPTLPPRLQKRFAPAVAAYVKYLKREKAQTHGDPEPDNEPDNVVASSIRSPDPMQQQAPANGDSTAPLNNDVGHDSAVESVGSPQAFRTPPEQPLEDLNEAATTHSPQPRAVSTPTVFRAQEPSEEPENDTDEQEACETSAIPQGAHEPEEEDELIDELEDDDRGDIASGEQHGGSQAKPGKLPTDVSTAGADVEGLVTSSVGASSRADAAAAHPPSDKQDLFQTGDANQTASDSQIDGEQQQTMQNTSAVGHRSTVGSDEEIAPPISDPLAGKMNEGTPLTAADQSGGATAAGGTNEGLITTQEPPADLDVERVARDLEAVEQTVVKDSAMLPESVETPESFPNTASAIEAPAQATDGTTSSTSDHDAVNLGSSAVATEAAAAAVIAAPHPAPFLSDANEIVMEAQTSEIQKLIETSHADAITDAATVGNEVSQTAAVAPAPLPAGNPQAALDMPDAAGANVDTGNPATGAAELSGAAGSFAHGLGVSAAAEVLDEPCALHNRDIVETSFTADEARASRNDDRASSQTASDAGTGGRAKKTIDDRMKSMLNDLAKVTGRRSSYETVKELKTKRAGFATPRTVQDVVDNWQDPAQLIPWTCLQELGPGVFHKNAHKHMHLSMHELMDKVSSTKAVKHLSRLPERVMTRALMEFPRVPHMMHCWNEEKRKYFDSRGSAQPKDTKPEFRFADEEEEVEGDAEVRGSTSAPPAGHGGAGHVAVPDRKPGTASPVMAAPRGGNEAAGSHVAQPGRLSELPDRAAQRQVMTGQLLASQLGQAPRTQPRPVAHPSMSQVDLDQLPPRPAPAPQASVQRQHHVQSAPTPPSERTLQELFQRGQATSTAVAPVALATPAPPVHAQPLGALTNERRAAMLRQATDRVFSGLAADCLSLAEHVIGSPASAELNVRSHFSEADVLHVLDFVVATYRREMEAERATGPSRVKSEQRFAKIMRVRDCAMEVLTLTQTLCRVKMCLNDAASDSLRRTGVASSDGWLELLATSTKWTGIRQSLLSHEAAGVGMLSGAEMRLMLGRQVDLVNKRLEGLLERLMSMDEVVGGEGGGTEEERGVQEAIRKECEQIGRICCKHVVGILLGEGERHS